eukprot:scaffold67141_cov19-Prasinocladus_malaysianus.AAC.1
MKFQFRDDNAERHSYGYSSLHERRMTLVTCTRIMFLRVVSRDQGWALGGYGTSSTFEVPGW